MDDSVQRQICILNHRIGQRVVLPVARVSIECDATVRLHLIPQARTGKGR